MKSRSLVHLLFIAASLLLLQACDFLQSSDDSDSSDTTTSGVYSLSDGSTVATTGKTYASATSNQSAVYVSQRNLDAEYAGRSPRAGTSRQAPRARGGVNAAVLASSSSATISISGGTISSSAAGGNAAVAYNGSAIALSGVTIANTGSGDCRALYATYGGIIGRDRRHRDDDRRLELRRRDGFWWRHNHPDRRQLLRLWQQFGRPLFHRRDYRKWHHGIFDHRRSLRHRRLQLDPAHR